MVQSNTYLKYTLLGFLIISASLVVGQQESDSTTADSFRKEIENLDQQKKTDSLINLNDKLKDNTNKTELFLKNYNGIPSKVEEEKYDNTTGLTSSNKHLFSNEIPKEPYYKDLHNVAARIGLVLLVIGGVVLVIFFLRKLTDRVQDWMVINKKKYFTGLRFGNYEFMPPNLHLDIGIKVVSFLKWALYLLTLYLSLPLIFGLFPFTKGLTQTLFDWILNPAKNIIFGFWDYLPNLFTIAVMYIITYYLVKLLRFITSEVENGHLHLPGFFPDWAMPTYRLAKFFIYAFMLVMIYPYLPRSESEIFKGVSIFLGILISLGSTSAVANAVAGLLITYMRPFRLGDTIKVGEVSGEVIEKTLLVTRIRTSKNEDITVPNSSILTGHTINYTSSSKDLGLILHTSVTIGYNVSWRKVHELLIEAAVMTEGINVSREPFVLQISLDDWYVSYQLNAFTDTPEQMPRIYSDLHANIQDKFNETGIEIMSPHYRAVRDGNESTVSKTGH